MGVPPQGQITVSLNSNVVKEIDLSGSLQIPQQNLTVSQEFNLYHVSKGILQKNLTPSGSQHYMATLERFLQTRCYITILSINWHGPSLRQTIDKSGKC